MTLFTWTSLSIGLVGKEIPRKKNHSNLGVTFVCVRVIGSYLPPHAQKFSEWGYEQQSHTHRSIMYPDKTFISLKASFYLPVTASNRSNTFSSMTLLTCNHLSFAMKIDDEEIFT